MDGRSLRRSLVVTGAIAGTATGLALGGLAELGTAQDGDAPPAPWIEATHLPPLLTSAGEEAELHYDAFCFAEDDVDAHCDADVEVHARRGDSGPFQELPVSERHGAPEGRFVAAVPAALSRSPTGFAYYAVLRDRRTGASVTLPAAGAAAPQRSYALGRPVEVSLGAHRFGAVRRASSRAAAAPWGAGDGAVGLEQGRQLPLIGGSSFDVASDGTVHVLDEANRRILRWHPGAAAPDEVPVAVNGTIADLAVADDGTAYVLETTAQAGEPPALRAFDARGRALGRSPLAERGSQVRLGSEGDALVLQQPSGQWMTVFGRTGPVSNGGQRATGRSGRPLADGGELVVLRHADEIRVAVVERGRVQSAWRVRSATPLAEVQLAEPLGRGVLLVFRAYAEAEDEFLALQLGERGLVRAFSVASSDWAETAPLSRFRLLGTSLYQLGSTPEGMFVDRFDLEVG